jgi:hypothetical protein
MAAEKQRPYKRTIRAEMPAGLPFISLVRPVGLPSFPHDGALNISAFISLESADRPGLDPLCLVPVGDLD